MGKIIIDNRSSLSDLDAISLVHSVIAGGRVSNDGKQYCYGTLFTIGRKQYTVWSDLNKKSDKLIITNKL